MKMFFSGLAMFVVFSQCIFAQSVTVYYDWMTDFSVKEMAAHGQNPGLIEKMNSYKRKRKYCYSNGQSVYQTMPLVDDHIAFGDRNFLARQYVEPYFYKNFAKDSMFVLDMKNEPTTVAGVKMGDWNNWEIMSDTLIVLGHVCQKAVLLKDGKISRIAWYALDIPIMDGPETYFGLPGLILEIKDAGGWIIRATSIEFGVCNELLVPDFDKKISYDEYLKRRKLFGRG